MVHFLSEVVPCMVLITSEKVPLKILNFQSPIWYFDLSEFYIVFPGKYVFLSLAKFLANVSKITWQVCNFPDKCVIFDQGKFAKAK